ncbi:Non-motile and phage-resistance protein [Pseudovibrio axinellae]|uniref:histidine kinase n=1 Tax=Pseudovibrio axinellae TaxID=989403 RepID=A0A161X9C7_9HYPH|nr:HAMP domain-containing sensor histidine kinase [Pseudovibrio axinellae]KZL08505.1 Non-motile and phage-resistance protein [Pseudovibrio axinellae]SEP76596.1 two-component system, cell cycle sensor histidine kinase PleC [Pseudovibrio axinellae]
MNNGSSQNIKGKTTINSERANRRREVARTLKDARERLETLGGVHPSFEADLILMFVKNRLSVVYAVPLIAFVAAGISTVWLPIQVTASWLVIMLLSHLLIILSTKRLEKSLGKEGNLRSIRRELLAGDMLYGVVWAIFFITNLQYTADYGFGVFQFATMLIVIAMATMLSSPLPGALLAATAPITVALIVSFWHYDSIPHYAMGLMAIGAQVFFYILSKQLHNSALTLLEYRAEKDHLISEMEQVNAISQEARRRAEEANLAKTRFLATMSHELRTPLNAILGFSEVMKDEVLGPMSNKLYLEYTRDINQSGQHLLNLINEILDLSRIEAGRYELQEEPVCLRDVAANCKHMMHMRAAEKNVEIHEVYEKGLNKVWADEKALRQMVLNLLTNAVKFTPAKGEITIQVGSDSAGGQYIRVSDTGAGIPEEEIPVVLQAFGQGTQAIHDAEQGTGLGLSIVQALAQMHGGEFELTSKLHEGTQATILLPVSRVLSQLDPAPTTDQNGRKDRESLLRAG